MTALRLMRKWSVPVATAVAVPLFSPTVVFADSGGKEPAKVASRMVRPSELPIYEEPEDVLDFEYHGRERTSLEEKVGVVRKEIEGVIESTRSTRERIVHICETGKAHTMATVDYITDEENTLSRAGAITIGGLAGLVLGARKKGGFVKKAVYTSTGVAATASLCYPRQAYQLSQQVYGNVKDYGNIGYNFVAGVKPQSKVAAPDKPKKEPPETPSPEAEAPSSTESTPASEEATATSESEGVEVRSLLPRALPDEKFPAPVDNLAQQSSDVMQWGFRLTDKTSNASSVPAVVVSPTEPTIPEGFGSVSEVDKDVAIPSDQVLVKDSVKDVDELKSPADEGPEIVETIAEEGPEVVETIAEEVAERIGDILLEKAADAVCEVAKETEKAIRDVAGVADLVGDVTETVSSIIDVVQEAVEGDDKAEDTHPVLTGVTKVVLEGTERVVDAVNFVAEGVEELAEKIADKVDVVEGKIVKFAEDEERREEIVEKVVDYVQEMASTISGETRESVEGTSIVEEKMQELVTDSQLDAKESIKEPVVEPVADIMEPVVEPVAEAKESAVEVQEPVAEVKESVVEPVAEVKEPAVEPLAEVKEPVIEPVAEVKEPAVEPIAETKELEVEPVVEVKEPEVELKEEEPIIETESEVKSLLSEPEEKVQELAVEPELEVIETATEGSEPLAATEVAKPEVEVGSQVTVRREGLFDKLVNLFSKDKEEKLVEKPINEAEKLSPLEEKDQVKGDVVQEEVEQKDSAEEVVLPVVEEVVLPVVEEIAEEVVEKLGEVAVEKVAEVVEEVSKEVEKDADIVAETSETVEEIGDKVTSALHVAEEVAEAAAEAAHDVPSVPKYVEEKAELAKEITEEAERVVDTITLIAEKVDDVAKEVKQEAEAVEAEALELIESEKKREEVVEKAVHIVTEKLSVDEKIDDVSEPVRREGLFTKLANFFKDSKKEELSPEDIKKALDEASKEVEKGADFVAETASKVEEVGDKVEEVLHITEEVAEAAAEAAHDVPIVSGYVEAAADSAKLITEEAEKVVDTVTLVAEKVDDVAEEVKKEVEVIGGEEKKEEDAEKLSEESIQQDGPEVEKVDVAISDVKPIDEKPDDLPVPVKRVGLFTKLADFFSDGKEEKLSQEVEKVADVVAEMASKVEEVGDKVEEVLHVTEEVVEAAAEAAHDIPIIPEYVEATADSAKLVTEEAEKVVDTVTLIAEKVDDVAEEVKKEVEVDEVKKEELIGGEEKKEEDAEKLSEESIQQDGPEVEKVDVAISEDVKPIDEKPDDLPVTVKRVGLFTKLADFFNDSKEEKLSQDVEKVADVVAVTASKVEEVGDKVEEVLHVTEEVAEAAAETAHEVPIVPEYIEAAADSAKLITEELEKVVDTVTLVAEKIEDVAEEVKQEVEVDDVKTDELTGGGEKKEEEAEKIPEEIAKAEEVKDVASTEELESVEKLGVAPVKKEGLFAKVADFFKDKPAEKLSLENVEEPVDAKAKESAVEELKDELMVEPVEEVKTVTESEEQLVEEVKTEPVETLKEILPKDVARPVLEDAVPSDVHTEVPDASEGSEEKGGLFGKLANIFSTDEEKKESFVVVTELPTEEVKEPLAEDLKEIQMEEPKDIVKFEKDFPSGSVVDKQDEDLGKPAVEEVSKDVGEQEKEGLVDKLQSLFSKGDEIAKAEPSVDELKEVPKDESSTEVQEQIVESVASEGIAVSDDVKDKPDEDRKEEKSEPLSESTDVIQNEGLIGKLSSLFSKGADEKDALPLLEQAPVVEESATELPDKTVEDSSLQVDVKEGADLVTEAVAPAEAAEKREGVFNKLINFLSSNDKAEETTDATVTVESLSESDDSKMLDDSEKPTVVDVTTEDAKATETEESTLSDETSVRSVEREGLFTKLGNFFSKTDDASTVVVESAAEPVLLDEAAEKKSVEETSDMEFITSEDIKAATSEEPLLEVKDKSLFSRLSEFVSGNDEKPNDSSAEAASDTSSQETISEPTQEVLPQQVPEMGDQQTESSETESQLSLLDRVASIFTKDNESVPVERQENEEKVESDPGSNDLGSKTGTDHDDELFVVLSKPSSPVETPVEEEGGQQAEQSTGWLQGSWFRSSASVTQEGKDVIVKVAPETPEKDYGQSNPEDTDMYTTRS